MVQSQIQSTLDTEEAGMTAILARERGRPVLALFSFAWMGRCRRLAKDFERSEKSSQAWMEVAATSRPIRPVFVCH